MLFTVAAVSALLGLAAASPVALNVPSAAGGDKPDPSQVFVQEITYAGTGCPAGTVATSFTNDRTIFTVLLDSYVASVGPSVPITESRKNCQLNIKIHYPAGFQYSILQATYRGFANLDKGITGTQKATYYFSGQQGTCSTQTDFKGPLNQDYQYTDNVPSTSTIWSPCGAQGMLNINSQIRLTGNGKGQGLLTTDSIDGNFKQVMALNWMRC